jgi:hypothetical protein
VREQVRSELRGEVKEQERSKVIGELRSKVRDRGQLRRCCQGAAGNDKVREQKRYKARGE